MPFGTATFGTPLGVLATMLPHSLVLRRSGANLDAQDMMVDFSAAGREALQGLGASGYNGEVDSAAVYCLPSADIAVGDVFRFAGANYSIMWVSPPGWGIVDGSTLVIAYARSTKARTQGAS